MGQWPWPRTLLADLLDRLTERGAAVVVFDMIFAEPDQTSPEQALGRFTDKDREAIRSIIGPQRSHDGIFADRIAASNVVLATALSSRGVAGAPPPKAGYAAAGDDPKPFLASFAGSTRNLPILDERAQGIGSINWTPDRDQVIRRVPLMFRVGDDYVPSLITESLRVAQGASTYVLKASNASGETAYGQTTGLNHIRVGAVEIPTDPDGGLWLRFRPSNFGTYLPAWKVLSGEIDPAEVEGRIMLIGTSAPGLIDLRATPPDASIAGVEVHAQAIEHILAGSSITRPDYATALELAIVVLLGLAVTLVLPRISASQSAVIGVVVITSLFVGGWLAFRELGLLLDPSFPALALSALIAAATVYVYRRVELQRGEVRRAFAHYVSPSVVDELIAHPEKLELGGVVRELTLLFCDMRNFTAISERFNAAELTRFINSLLTPLTDIILANQGTIDKYMGDAIMAFWNAPLDDKDHAEHACRSAVAMVIGVEALNVKWRAEDEAAGRKFVPVAIGIGINSGEALVGNLGSDQRFDYSCLGDEVNVASRLEGLSKYYGMSVVVGEGTAMLQKALAIMELDLIRVKGRARPSRIYTLVDALRAEAEQIDTLLPLHNAMLEALRTKSFDRAEALIGECQGLGIASLESFYRTYLARIVHYREEPPPDDWDGAYTAETK